MTRAAKSLIVPVFALQGIFFGLFAVNRFVDGDEGFYAMASRLVAMHRKPYIDFFYTQSPLLPYVYAAWMKVAGVSWVSAKLFAALMTALLGTLVYIHVCTQARKCLAGLAAVLLFSSCTFVFAWFPVVKTYSLAGLFLFAAYMCACRISGSFPRWYAIASGVLLALSIDTRSYLVVLIPVFLWYMFRLTDRAQKLQLTVGFALGMVLGLLPSLYLFLLSPDLFLFNNLYYHAVRSEAGLIGMWGEKLVVVLMLFMRSGAGNAIQNSLLFFVSLGFVVLIPNESENRGARFAFAIAITVAIVSLLPTPVYLQYFCLCAPFLVVAAVCSLNDFMGTVASERQKMLVGVACALGLVLYAGCSFGDLRRYLKTGEDVPGAEWADDLADWKLATVLEISKTVDQIVHPGDTAVSIDTAYILETPAIPLAGTENDFGLSVSERLTPEQRERYRIISPSELETRFAAHMPRVVVLRKQVERPNNDQSWRKYLIVEDEFRKSVKLDGYKLFRTVGNTEIYVDCATRACPD